MLTHHHWFSAGGGFVISEAISACGRARLRGGRAYADSARGTYPSGLPSIAYGRDGSRTFVLFTAFYENTFELTEDFL